MRKLVTVGLVSAFLSALLASIFVATAAAALPKPKPWQWKPAKVVLRLTAAQADHRRRGRVGHPRCSMHSPGEGRCGPVLAVHMRDQVGWLERQLHVQADRSSTSAR